MSVPARVAGPLYGQIVIRAKERFTYQHLYLSLCWLSWQAAWQNVVEKNWKRHLMDFILRTNLPRQKKIPFICTESCNFGLYFGKRWLTSLSLSCTTLAIAYFDLTTLFTCYCVWHPGIKPFDLCMALESYWLCYSTTNKNVEHLQVPHILTVRCFRFILSMV